MLTAVRDFIDREKLFADGRRRVVLAVSGGVDSVALTHLLFQLKEELDLTLFLCHVHHGLRGGAADLDARLVHELAARLGLEAFERRYDTVAHAHEHSVSVEMAARDLRHQAFAEVLAETGADCVALGHHRSDQAETILFRMVSGTSPNGASGMKVCAEVKGLLLVRPLLMCDKAALQAWLIKQGGIWREDVSNQEDQFLRNRMRHEILPAIRERINPAAEEHLVHLAGLIHEDNTYCSTLADQAYPEVCSPDGGQLNVANLNVVPLVLRRRIIARWLGELGLGRGVTSLVIEQVLQLCDSTVGSKRLELGGKVIVRSYDWLRVAVEELAGGVLAMRIPDRVSLPNGGDFRAEECLRPQLVRGQRIGVFPAEACISREKLGARSLTVRYWQVGDRFAPLGIAGQKKIQDIFVDAKVPKDLRERIPLVEVDGELIWVPGYQIAQGWEVRDFNSPAYRLVMDNIL